MTKNILKQFDDIIDRAKEYVTDINNSGKDIKEIESQAIPLLVELKKKNESIKNILMDMPPDPSTDISIKLKEGLIKTQMLIDNIQLFAEQNWYEEKENIKEAIDPKVLERQKKYAARENMRILNEINSCKKFIDLADITIQIKIDFDLFEEYGYIDELMITLVKQLNSTNIKKSTTRFTKNHKKTLAYIKNELFKSVDWDKKQIADYIQERNAEIYSKQNLPDKISEPLNILFLGMSKHIIDEIGKDYFIENIIKSSWMDITITAWKKLFDECKKNDLILIITNFQKHKVILKLRNYLENGDFKYILTSSTNSNILINSMADKV